MLAAAGCLLAVGYEGRAEAVSAAGQPARLEIRRAGEQSLRVTLMPASVSAGFATTPVLAPRDYPDPEMRLRDIGEPVQASIGPFLVQVRPAPLSVTVTRKSGEKVQEVTFAGNGELWFSKSSQPVLGLGEGGPQPAPRGDWREQSVQFDRNGARHQMIPRWESGAYGSRNPVALMIGTEGWGLFIATPWGEIDLREEEHGVFKPWLPPESAIESSQGRRRAQERERALQGRPPLTSILPGAYDLFVFDTSDPEQFMKDLSLISGPAVLPPKWSLGYMQSHRELVDASMASQELLLWVVDTFREKQLPIDAVIYLGTGFTPTGWNMRQPSFEFNPEVFRRPASEVLEDLHRRHVKVVAHIVPWNVRRLPTLHGTIPPAEGEQLDASHIQSYWREHVDLVSAGVDAWWPDEGDRFNLFERIKRHQLYYQGPLSTQPDVRPWSLHRNGHLGIARWGGWVWSGDTQSAWKTLEAQIAVGINHSLSLSPYWGSDTGGFYAGVDPPELSGELYARWFQFSAFCPSFRSHGRIWRLRTPFGWGLSDMGFTEEQRFPPNESELNNPFIEPVCRKYAELRYQLIPYTYTLAAEARETGLPFMRALWLHYPKDERIRGLGDQYLWGRDLLIAPVYQKGAGSRDVYLPAGRWHDFWTNKVQSGGQTVTREVDLATLPVYVRAGAILPLDPVRQYVAQEVEGATTLRIYSGADGRFRWYEDDGKSLGYLHGESCWTTLTWDDAGRRFALHREASAGGWEPPRRKLILQVLPEGATREIDYAGDDVQVDF